MYRSRHFNGSRYVSDDSEYNIYNNEQYTKKNAGNVVSGKKKQINKSLLDSLRALHEMSKNSQLHAELIDEDGYNSVVDIMYILPHKETELFLLCGEFYCNLSDNVAVNFRLLPMRVVESMLYSAKHLEFNQVFLCRMSRSFVNLSASKVSTESLVWQKGIASLSEWSKYDEVIVESLHKCLFNVVTSSTYKILPWFRECCSLAVKIFHKQERLQVDVQAILLSAISHLASFPSLANALIGLLLIGKLRDRIGEIIHNKKYYLLLGERVLLLELIVKVIYNMSRAVDASSKMSDENIDKMLEDILDFLAIGHYSGECTNLILGALGNIGRSPHARSKLIPQGVCLILQKSCLKCVKQIADFNPAAGAAKSPEKGKEHNTLGKEAVYKDRLRICVESLLHFTSDKKFMLDTCRQGSLRVLSAVCKTTVNIDLLYTSFVTACNILSSEILEEIYNFVPNDVEEFIIILLEQIKGRSLEKRANDNDSLGYIATALRNVTLNFRLIQFIANTDHPLAEYAIDLAYRSFHDESILVLCTASLYNSTKNSTTIKPLYSHKNVEKIIGIMKRAKTPRVDELCLATLQNVTHAFESAGKIYKEGGAIEELVELAMSKDDNTRSLAVSVLCTLTFDKSNAETLVQHNTLETLVEVARTSSSNASRVAAALNNFSCIFNGKYINKLIDVGAIKALLSMLSSDRQVVRNQAAQALCHVSCFTHYNYLALPLVPGIICRSDNTSTYWKSVVDEGGVEQIMLTGLLRNPAENQSAQEFCCTGFYTLVSKAGVLHPLNKSIAWGAGRMYNLSDLCKDMANRILINLSESAEGRLLIDDTECLAEAANALLKMSAIEEQKDKNATEHQIGIMVHICDVFYNVMTAKKVRVSCKDSVLLAVLQFAKAYGAKADFVTRRRLIDLMCIFASTEGTVSLFATSRGFLILESLYKLDKKERKAAKISVEETIEIMKRGAIASYAASLRPRLRLMAGMDGALERLLECDPEHFDVPTKKLVGVGIYNYSLVEDSGLRHTMAKRGGLKICRELLEEKGIDRMIFMNRQRVFCRMAYLLSQTDEGLRLIMIEKGIMRVLLPCSLTKDPVIANEVATSLCKFSEIKTGLVHLVHGGGVKATTNIIQNGARNFFHPKTIDSYEKCAISLSNMACHTNSQPKLVREGIIGMLQRLSGGKSEIAVDACGKAIACLGTNDKACTCILATRGVIDNLVDWYQSARNQNGPQWRTVDVRIAFAIYQASLVEGSVEKKLKKEETYAMKTIRGLEKESLESLRLKMTTDPDELKTLVKSIEFENSEEPFEVFTKHNRLPTVPIIYDEQKGIEWIESEYQTELAVSATKSLEVEPSYEISWADKEHVRLERLSAANGGLKRALPPLVDVRNSIYQETSLQKAIPQYIYGNDESFYVRMAKRLKFIEDTNRKAEMQKQLVTCIKSLAIVSFDNHVKEALHRERERIFKLEEAERKKLLAEEMAKEARKPIVSPTHRPAVVSFTKLPTLLQTNASMNVTRNGIIGVRQIVQTIRTFELNRSEIIERNFERHEVISDYLRESNATAGTAKRLKSFFGVTTPVLGQQPGTLKLSTVANNANTLNKSVEDVDINIDEADKLLIQNEGVATGELTPLLEKKRNEQQYNIVSEYLRETHATPGRSKVLKATFDVTTPSTSSQIETETPPVDLTEPINPIESKSMPKKTYSRNTQRKNIVSDFAKDKNLTPGAKRRINEYFDTRLDDTNRIHKMDPRAERYEEYSFGDYSRKYYN